MQQYKQYKNNKKTIKHNIKTPQIQKQIKNFAPLNKKLRANVAFQKNFFCN